ncbi:MAG: T9SS type A sorting domain-containing protein [Flavobacteriia bacterium]|nr:T9SS type A sorting domain-containing protein [Flavobacteriia bacterium]
MFKGSPIHFKLPTALVILFFGLFVSHGVSQVGASDPSFNTADLGFGLGEGADYTVNPTVLLPDGKYLIGGGFKKYNNAACEGIRRINHDGSLDPTWNVGGTGATNSSYGAVYDIAVQPDGKIIIVGDFTKYNGVTKNRIARLNTDGTLDVTFNPGTGLNNLVGTIVLLPDGKMLVGGSFTTVNGLACAGIARLNSDGTRDVSFNSGGIGVTSSGSSYSTEVGAILLLADGRIYIGGAFSGYNGQSRIRSAILNADGSLDPGFLTSPAPGGGANAGASDFVHDAAQQPDGKLVIVGKFTHYGGTSRNAIVRVNLDGSLDMTFNPSILSSVGFNNSVYEVNVLSDGDILCGGAPTSYSGTPISKVARLNSDGTLDLGFNTGSGFGSQISSTISVSGVMPQPDGKILVGGYFQLYNGVFYQNLVRLNANGELDTTFNPGSGFNGGAVNTVVELVDGKLLVGGEFNRFNGEQVAIFVKLNADGTLDETFPQAIFGSSIKSMKKVIVQPNGKILVAGSFSTVNGSPRDCIARLNPDGTLDSGFNPNLTSDTIHAMVLQPDGKILIGGRFSSVNGVSRVNLARLNADGTLDATFVVGSGFLNAVRSLALQSDGKVVVGGDFTYYAGNLINRILRLTSSGALDATFDVGNGCNNAVNSIVIQPDGKILIGGKFGVYKSTLTPRIARILPNGNPDPSFSVGSGFNSTVSEICLKGDGKMFVGGTFATFNGASQKGIVCLNQGGSLNTSYQFGTGVSTNTDVRSIIELSNGRLLIAGDFTSYNGIGRNRMAWLNNPANTYSTINQNVCNSYTGPSGTNYSVSGTYTEVIANAAGTDSIVTLNLTINPTVYHNDFVTNCGPYTWSNGVTYSGNTTASQTLSSQTGCDSIITLHLTVNQSNSGIQAVSACESFTWIDGVTYTESTSTPTHILTNVHGCDSTVTLHLTIQSPTSGTHVVTACESYTWINGITYTSSNNSDTYMLQNSFGCDSLVTLNLSVLQSSSNLVNVSSCGNYTWPQNGQTYYTSGNYIDVLSNVAGCDSVVTLQLTILESSQGTNVVSACGNYTWAQNGETYSASGNYIDVLSNVAGCDSVVTLQLTILESSQGIDVVSACGNYTWIDGINYVSSTSSPTFILQNVEGCDSLVSLNLTISPFSNASAIDNGDGTVSAVGNATTYQWLDCGINAVIIDETNAVYTPEANGSYAVIISSSGNCADTSDCIFIDYLNVNQPVLSDVSVQPNPTMDQVVVNFSGGKAELIIMDTHGKFVFSKELSSGDKVSLENQEAGVYFFIVKTEAGSEVERVVKW